MSWSALLSQFLFGQLSVPEYIVCGRWISSVSGQTRIWFLLLITIGCIATTKHLSAQADRANKHVELVKIHDESGKAMAVESIQQEYRLVWGGPNARSYQGTISVSGGRMRLVRNLSVQPGAAGTVVQVDSQSISLLASPETTFGGVDLTVEGDLSCSLQIELQDSPTSPASQFSVSLSELQKEIWIRPLSESICRIAIERQVFDKLRVQDNRPSKIFQCGEDWPLKISGDSTGLAGGEYQLMLAWAGRRSLNTVATIPVKLDASGSFPLVETSVKIPSIEGVHRLELSLVRTSLVPALSTLKPLLSRSLELVALAVDQSPKHFAGWRPLLAIDTVAATKTGNLSWLASFAHSPLAARGLEIAELPSLSELSSPEQWNRLLSLGRSVTSNGPVGYGGKIAVRDFPIPSNPKNAEPKDRCVSIYSGAWLALPLSNLQPGVPHRLRIEVPTDRSGMLNVIIKDAANIDQVAISPQQSIYLPEGGSTIAGESIAHEVLFWPRSESIQIVLSSGHRTAPASVGKILVETAQYINSPRSSSRERQETGEVQESQSSGRMIGLYIDQPFLADCLAAPRDRDSKTGSSLETWETWQAVAERLGLHLELSGANTLILLAAGDGGSLFPIQSVHTVPWLDKSTFFTDGRAPNAHDFLELLLRHLQRTGMRLVIELDLNSYLSLPVSREAKISGWHHETQQDPLLQEGPTGASEDDSLAIGSALQGRQLGPLHSDVQSAVSKVVREVVQRYKDFPALAGISLRLRPDSFLLFEGGYDRLNIDFVQQYAKEGGLQLPSEQDRLLELFEGSSRLGYLNWRADRLSEFYGQLTRNIQQMSPGLKLYLNTVRLWAPMETDAQRASQLTAMRNPQQYLLGFGLNIEKLSTIDGLVISQGSVRNGWVPLSSKEWARITAADSGAILPALVPQAAMVTHQPRLGRPLQRTVQDSDGEAESAMSASIRPAVSEANREHVFAYARQFVDSVVTGPWARQALLEQLLRSDQQMLAFGGWYPVWTLEPLLKDFAEAFKALPPIVLQDLPLLIGDSPIRIRRGSFDNKDYLLLINASSIDCELKLSTDSNEIPAFAILGSSNPECIASGDGDITVNLAAGAMLAWAWQGSGPKLMSAKLTPSQNAIANITQRLERLESNLARALDAVSQRVLLQSSGTFEQWQDATKPIGWNMSSLPKTIISRAQELPHSGQSCILIENNNREPAAAWIQSNSIELPTTGRLAVRAWLRSSAADHRQPVVRLGVTGRMRNGSRYQQSVYYGGPDNGARPIANDWGRRPAELHIADIPVDDLVDLKIAIDLIGEGKIWVDDVEVVETWLHPEERNYLRGQLLVAKQKLAENNPFSAEKLLKSNWNLYLMELDSNQFRNPTAREPSDRSSPAASPAWNQPKTAFQQWRETWFDRWQR